MTCKHGQEGRIVCMEPLLDDHKAPQRVKQTVACVQASSANYYSIYAGCVHSMHLCQSEAVVTESLHDEGELRVLGQFGVRVLLEFHLRLLALSVVSYLR